MFMKIIELSALLFLLSILSSCQKHNSLPLFTVTYSGNGNTGGTAPIDSKSYPNGATVTVLNNTGTLLKTGYTFGNWNTSQGGSGFSYAEGATFQMSGACIILYADWIAAGSTWTTQTLPSPGTGSWISVAYGNNTFVAISTNSNATAASTDGGKTWKS